MSTNTTSTNKYNLAIIGGGASAVLLLANLARMPKCTGMNVDVYDRAGRFGRGIAYSTIHDVHLLNVRAANMSAFHDDKDDFAVWAGHHGFAPKDFVPRKMYARYLQEKLEGAQKVLNIRFVQADVIASQKIESGYRLSTSSGEAEYSAIVAATGNVRPLRPKISGDVAGYYDDPWTMDFDGVLKAKNIALVGSGLSAVDVIVALYARGYDGKICVFSRNGLFPLPHVDPVPYDDFLEGHDAHTSVRRLLRAIRSEVKDAGDRNIPWQSVIDSLRVHTNTTWQKWPDVERKKFMKRLLTFWNVHRHRMAPQIDNILQSMISSGQVTINRQRVDGVVDGPHVVCGSGNISFDAVINCLGYRYDEDGREYDVSARIGPARFGELFETTAIPEIRAHAAEVATTIGA